MSLATACFGPPALVHPTITDLVLGFHALDSFRHFRHDPVNYLGYGQESVPLKPSADQPKLN